MENSKKLAKGIAESFENHEVAELSQQLSAALMLLPNSVTVREISLLMRLNTLLGEVTMKITPAASEVKRLKFNHL